MALLCTILLRVKSPFKFLDTNPRVLFWFFHYGSSGNILGQLLTKVFSMIVDGQKGYWFNGSRLNTVPPLGESNNKALKIIRETRLWWNICRNGRSGQRGIVKFGKGNCLFRRMALVPTVRCDFWCVFHCLAREQSIGWLMFPSEGFFPTSSSSGDCDNTFVLSELWQCVPRNGLN